MKNAWVVLPFLCFPLFFTVLAACGNNAMNKEYDKIKASGLTGDDLRAALTEFELNNMDHFSSKVDLGGYYMITGNPERALDYLLRAEKLVSKAPRSAETRKNTVIMYGSIARIYLLQGEFTKAMDYAEKAVLADDETGKQYRFLQAHILTAQEKQDEALALFYELYQTQRDIMSPDDIQAFMYLLAKTGNYSDCAIMVDLYFEKGAFFQGLGLFASGAYEAVGQANKAIIAAFLDYEYHIGYSAGNDSDFLRNLDNLERQLNFRGILPETEATLRLIRSLYDNSELAMELRPNAFFGEDYAILKKKILANTMSVAEFGQYLQLERYFTRFPVYYWNVWKAALEYAPNALAAFAPALEKIIRLDANGPYAQLAWTELTKLMGYQ